MHAVMIKQIKKWSWHRMKWPSRHGFNCKIRFSPVAQEKIIMRIIAALGAVVSLACVSAAASPSNYQTYFGTRVDASPTILAQFDQAASHCDAEASMPGRNTPAAQSYSYEVAVRNCMARFNFIDRGSYAYLPIVLGLDHILDR